MASLPPLVEPAAPLTEAEFARYSRHVLLSQVGEMGQRRLKAAHVLIIGAGGLGSPALQYLAAAGVGTIGIIDDDEVDETNLQRQVIHRTQDIGDSKVSSAVRAVRDLNPLVKVHPYPFRLTNDNAAELFTQYDVVLDGADNFPTRYLVSDAAAEVNIPVLWASVLAFDAQLSLFWARPPVGDGVTLRDLFPHPPEPGLVPSCSQAGVVGAMVGQVGALMAAEAVKLIIGVGEVPLGTVLVFDQLRSTWTSLPLRPRTTAPTEGTTPEPRANTPATPAQATDVRYTDVVSHGQKLVDVREDDEVARGMISGATHIPLALLLTERGRKSLTTDSPIVVYCQLWPRAEQAARELTVHGFDVEVLAGGYAQWTATQWDDNQRKDDRSNEK